MELESNKNYFAWFNFICFCGLVGCLVVLLFEFNPTYELLIGIFSGCVIGAWCGCLWMLDTCYKISVGTSPNGEENEKYLFNYVLNKYDKYYDRKYK